MTPEEKAKKFGVPLIPAAEPRSPFQKGIIPQSSPNDKMYQYMNETVSICGGCGKEIKRSDFKQPCGSNICPFGFLTNSIATL